MEYFMIMIGSLKNPDFFHSLGNLCSMLNAQCSMRNIYRNVCCCCHHHGCSRSNSRRQYWLASRMQTEQKLISMPLNLRTWTWFCGFKLNFYWKTCSTILNKRNQNNQTTNKNNKLFYLFRGFLVSSCVYHLTCYS